MGANFIIMILTAMVWAGVCFGPQTQVPFIGGILNTDGYSEEILRAIVVPFIINTLQHYAWPHVDSRICSQFLEAENVPVPAWPADSPDMSPLCMFGMLWIGGYDSSCQ